MSSTPQISKSIEYPEALPNVVGYSLEKALNKIGEADREGFYTIITDETITPYEDKKNERQGNTPIVVRQIVKDNKIKLTTSLFK